MKKDIYNGKIRREYINYLNYSFILFSFLLLVATIVFFFTALFYDNMDNGTRIMLYVLSGLCLLGLIFYPIITICLVRKYPKYSRLTKLLVKSFLFVDSSDDELNF